MRNLISILVFLFLIGTHVFGQKLNITDYPPITKVSEFPTYDWKEINTMIENELPRKAIETILVLQEKAIAEKNVREFWKTCKKVDELVDRANYEEKEQEEFVWKYTQKVDGLAFPMNVILHNYLAEWTDHLMDYSLFSYDDESLLWNINGTKEKLNYDKAKELVAYHKNQLLQNPMELMKMATEDYYPFDIERLNFTYKPTLFDVFAHYKIPSYTPSSDDFTDLKFLLDTDDMHRAIGYKDSLYANFLLYYHLEKLNWANKRYDVYAYNIEKRLNFAKSSYDWEFRSANNIDSLVNESYKLFENKLNFHASSSRFTLHIADGLNKQAESYHWKNNSRVKSDNVLALKKIETSLSKFPDSEFKKQLMNLKEHITSSSLDFYLKSQVLQGEKYIMNVAYTNVKQSHLTIYKVEKATKPVNQQNPLKNYTLREISSQIMDYNADSLYLKHSKDFILSPLKEKGDYLFLMTKSKGDAATVLSIDTLAKCTNFSYKVIKTSSLHVSTKTMDGAHHFLVTNSMNGKPVANAKIYLSVHSYRNNNTTLEPIATLTTDKSGKAKFGGTTSYTYKVVLDGDSISGHIYQGYRYDEEGDIKVNLYTDRAIYRPGQTVHFKFITTKRSGDEYKLKDNQLVQLEIKDNNYKTVFSENIISSNFGSGSGTFAIPLNGILLGEMRIYVNGNFQHEFRVEEYKRPTFEVLFDTIKEQYALGDTVRIKGRLKAFAGYPLQGAKVNVTVAQSYYRFRGFSGYHESAQSFDVVSDKNGEFTVAFYADKNESGYGANFDISATATDLSGEVQEGSTYLYIGKQSFSIYTDLSGELISNNENIAVVRVENNQQVEQKNVPLKYVLEKIDESKWYTEHLDEAEYKSFLQAEFESTFPHISYFENQTKENKTYVSGITKSGDSLQMNLLTNQKAGKYRLIITGKDATGEEIRSESMFNYINLSSKEGQHKDEFWVLSQDRVAQVGEKVSIYLGSSYKKLYVYAESFNQKGIKEGKWIKLNQRKELVYTMTEADRGVFGVNFICSYKGKFYQQEVRITVPKEDKNLEIKLQTMKDFLKPGSKEKWTMTINDKSGNKADAELLVSMYDESLDQFVYHSWDNTFQYEKYVAMNWRDERFSPVQDERDRWSSSGFYASYLFEFYSYGSREDAGVGSSRTSYYSTNANRQQNASVAFTAPVTYEWTNDKMGMDSMILSVFDEKEIEEKSKSIQPRSNFNETAFFYPTIFADPNGTYKFEFTLPDALTKWRFMSLAHTRDLKTGYYEHSFVAKKELMVEPNEPRFFREGDFFVFTSKVVNMTEKSQDVVVRLKFIDPITEADVTGSFGIITAQKITIPANGSQEVMWNLSIPTAQLSLVAYLIEAEGSNFSDAEKKAIPILSNRMLVSESKPFVKTTAGDQTFTLEKVNQLSPTAEKISLRLEMQTQPLWTTLMSLPYLMEFPYECAEQTFSRYFGNILAQKIIQDNPAFGRVIATWKETNPQAFLSELEKNPELKSIILSETPWVIDAQRETAQRHRLAALFEGNNLESNCIGALEKLKQMQSADGGWGWFGGESNLYITQHIVTGFGQLKQLGVDFDETMANEALAFLEKKYAEQFTQIKKAEREKLIGLSDLHVHWLVARSYFNSKSTDASIYYSKCLAKDWKNFNLHTQALAGMSAIRTGDKAFAEKIKNSILDRATKRPEMGMYWNENKTGYYWNQSQVETQSAIIEFFTAYGDLDKEVQQMQLWLLQQKRSNAWETTKATTTACHALLVNKTAIQNQLGQVVKVKMGDGTDLGTLKKEAGSTFTWTGKDITTGKASVTVNTLNEQPVFGAIHFQYLEDMNKITKSVGDIRLERHYYWTNNGKEEEISSSTVLPVGTKVKVKMTVTANRPMEFVHLKDSKASGFEAREALSGYHWSTVSYYQVSKDASTDFFIDYLPKGSHSFEYEIFASGKGNLTIGAAIVECMYAPSFRANSNGGNILVK